MAALVTRVVLLLLCFEIQHLNGFTLPLHTVTKCEPFTKRQTYVEVYNDNDFDVCDIGIEPQIVQELQVIPVINDVLIEEICAVPIDLVVIDNEELRINLTPTVANEVIIVPENVVTTPLCDNPEVIIAPSNIPFNPIIADPFKLPVTLSSPISLEPHITLKTSIHFDENRINFENNRCFADPIPVAMVDLVPDIAPVKELPVNYPCLPTPQAPGYVMPITITSSQSLNLKLKSTTATEPDILTNLRPYPDLNTSPTLVVDPALDLIQPVFQPNLEAFYNPQCSLPNPFLVPTESDMPYVSIVSNLEGFESQNIKRETTLPMTFFPGNDLCLNTPFDTYSIDPFLLPANPYSTLPPSAFNLPAFSSALPTSCFQMPLVTCSVTSANPNQMPITPLDIDLPTTCPGFIQAPVYSKLDPIQYSLCPANDLSNINSNFALPPVRVTPSPIYDATSLEVCSPIINDKPVLTIPSSIRNPNNPIGRYFEDVRVVTAKLYDFISSFNSRPLNNYVRSVRTPVVLTQPELKSSYFDRPAAVISVLDPPIVVSPLNDRVSAPKVPSAFGNICSYPVSPIPYYTFQESLSSLSYSNFLPIPYAYNSVPSYANSIEPVAYNNSPYLSSFYSNPVCLPENPYAYASLPSAPVVPKVPSFTYTPPNFNNVFSSVPNSVSVATKKPLPYLSTVSFKTAPGLDDGVESLSANKYSVKPKISAFVAPSSSDASVIDLCCKNIERLVALLELKKIANGDTNYDVDRLSKILSTL